MLDMRLLSTLVRCLSVPYGHISETKQDSPRGHYGILYYEVDTANFYSFRSSQDAAPRGGDILFSNKNKPMFKH